MEEYWTIFLNTKMFKIMSLSNDRILLHIKIYKYQLIYYHITLGVGLSGLAIKF